MLKTTDPKRKRFFGDSNLKPNGVTVFLYGRLFDPLIQGNFWVFIKGIQERTPGQYHFRIVSYEDAERPLTDAQLKQVQEMEAIGVSWSPLKWHPGQGVISKVTDLISGFFAVTRERLKGNKHVIAYGSVAASFCYLYSLLLGVKLFLYSYEPHSEYARDNGILSEQSLQYRVLHFLERKAANAAAVISSGTVFMKRRLLDDWAVTGEFFKIPSVTDNQKFAFNGALRAHRRAELGLDPQRKVIFYPGKFGGLYYAREITQMFRWLLDEDPDLFFLVLSPQSAESIRSLFAECNVPESSYKVDKADYENIEQWFWVADFGIIAVPPGDSKKFISNIKVGEYLCAGLPFLITRGVSEDSIVAADCQVGVVVDGFTREAIRDAWPSIRSFLEMDPVQRRAHCTKVGLEYRGFQTLQARFETALSALVGRDRVL
ncbi:hypothetical protein GCM10011385_40740 [Nitratireductor aestuarii]|uniref:Glycosyltransferase subfamily 4-like N-terminal domain-containing protein n=1 Tax=Nitratireductor aestuarii TaxID=1735103 RepID=A0A916S408_9HYPH|nr:hypothetical protein [Nitratireductor aestuarii]GGA82373.1 hypothetical protein GCM10011385_40740 [Nitratireductor aestuarii]